MRAIKKNDLENILYYQTPKWLFDLLLTGEITPGAYSTYVLMYDRTRLSAKNNWIDKNGDVYIKYSYDEMLEDLKIKSNTQIQRNLRKLEELNLVDKKKNYSSSTTYYLNIYSPTQSVSISPTQSVSISPTQSVETSNNNFSNNNIERQSDSQDDNNLKSDVVKFVQLLMNQSIRFTPTECNKIIGICEELKVNPMSSYNLSSYLRGDTSLSLTKRMFLNINTYQKMKLGDYNDKQTVVKNENKIVKKKLTPEQEELIRKYS